MASQSQDSFEDTEFEAMRVIQANGWTLSQIHVDTVVIYRRTSPSTQQVLEAHMPRSKGLAYLARAVAE